MSSTAGEEAAARQKNAHPFDVRQDLVPKEAPKFDYAADELVILNSNKLPVEGIHARANKFRGLSLESGDCPGWRIGHDTLYVAFHKLVQVLSVGDLQVRNWEGERRG